MNEEKCVMCFSSTRYAYLFTYLNLKLITQIISHSDYSIFAVCMHIAQFTIELGEWQIVRIGVMDVELPAPLAAHTSRLSSHVNTIILLNSTSFTHPS